MGHHIRGFVAEAEGLRKIAQRYRHFRTVDLHCGLAFAPLTDECADELTEGVDAESDITLRPEYAILKDTLLRDVEFRVAAGLSMGLRLAYVETDYFGGKGHQFAVGWHDGAVAHPPTFGTRPGPINGALAFLGVTAAWGRDEFASVGLQHFRYEDDFEDQQSEYYKPTYLQESEAAAKLRNRLRSWWRSLWH